MKIIVNNEALAATLGVKAGDEVEVECSKRGRPVDRVWRNRFRDAAIDGCISAAKETKPKANKSGA